MMKPKYVLILLLLLPVFIMICVNEFSPAPTTVYQEDVCTRYCHNKTCMHMRQNKLTNTLFVAYGANIKWLKDNSLGISYREMNLLVYVLLYPLSVILLLWGLLRRKHG